MADTVSCRAVLISAPASGQGKTTVTAALARHFSDRGERVTVFKSGPDFLDPMMLSLASRSPVHQLDLFMGGEAHCRSLLYAAAQRSDLILIEGVMGLFDGAPSSADLAARFGIPVIAVIDASAMAGTFAAIVHGLTTYRSDIVLAGVIANRVGSARHAQMLGTPLLAHLPRAAEITLPERHLGLVPPGEVAAVEDRLAHAAALLGQSLRSQLPLVKFAPGTQAEMPPKLLQGQRIAIARDAAFCFLYTANLDLLRNMGAECIFFSPLTDHQLPHCDALYLPGGYPELHLDRLANNVAMKRAIKNHHAHGKPILAECGGLLYLLDRLAGLDGSAAEMVGLLPGQARMQPRLAALALQSVSLPEGTLRGHTFHHSLAEISETPVASGICPNGSKTQERVYRKGRLTASYIHFYFPSHPEAAAALFLP